MFQQTEQTLRLSVKVQASLDFNNGKNVQQLLICAHYQRIREPFLFETNLISCKLNKVVPVYLLRTAKISCEISLTF
jgi:hypothetical protein